MPETATQARPDPVGRADYDLDRMAALALEAYRSTGRWPTPTSLVPIAGTNRTWGGLNDRLRKAGASLAKFLDGRFPEERARAREAGKRPALRPSAADLAARVADKPRPRRGPRPSPAPAAPPPRQAAAPAEGGEGAARRRQVECRRLAEEARKVRRRHRRLARAGGWAFRPVEYAKGRPVAGTAGRAPHRDDLPFAEQGDPAESRPTRREGPIDA